MAALGYEVICKAVDCVHNEDEFSCRLSASPAKPIILGEQGRCTWFELMVEETREGA